MIFVFGSNKSGFHGLGAAKYALNHKGAIYGIGEGLAGQSYALPTKGYKIERIGLGEIKWAVMRFINFANEHPEMDFQVTRVGCGLGGHRDEYIAPMFHYAPDNCFFDTVWNKYLKEKKYWGTF